MRKTLQRFPRLMFIATGLLGLAGCWGSEADEQQASDEKLKPQQEAEIEIPNGTPGELSAVLREAARAAKQLAGRTTRTDDPEQTRELHLQVRTGVKAAEMLIDHPDADAAQRESARKVKLALLYVGAKRDESRFENQFGDFVQQLIEQDPHSEATAIGSATWLRWKHLSAKRPTEEVLPLLVDYAKSFPDSDQGIGLFERYARGQAANGDREAAKQAYRTGIEHYERHPEVHRLQRQLRKLEHAEAVEDRRRREDQRSREARIARIKRRAGNHDGYFVLYAEEQPTTSRTAMIYWYSYEYEVVLGTEALIRYVQKLPEQWTWKVVARFPDSRDGRADAYEKRNELLSKKRGGKKK